MNPLWFFIGLEVGDRLRANRKEIRQTATALLDGAIRRATDIEQSWRGHAAYRRWLDSLPTTEGGDRR